MFAKTVSLMTVAGLAVVPAGTAPSTTRAALGADLAPIEQTGHSFTQAERACLLRHELLTSEQARAAAQDCQIDPSRLGSVEGNILDNDILRAASLVGLGFVAGGEAQGGNSQGGAPDPGGETPGPVGGPTPNQSPGAN